MSNLTAHALMVKHRLKNFRKIQLQTPKSAAMTPPRWVNWEEGGRVWLRKKKVQARLARKLSAENASKGWKFRIRKWSQG